jgi:hypothetical protein
VEGPVEIWLLRDEETGDEHTAWFLPPGTAREQVAGLDEAEGMDVLEARCAAGRHFLMAAHGGPPPDLAQVRGVLRRILEGTPDAPAGQPPPVRLTPPPRADPIRPISPPAAASDVDTHAARGRRRWPGPAALGLAALAVITAAIFLLLPRWAENRNGQAGEPPPQPQEVDVSPGSTTPEPPPLSQVDLRERAYLKQQAEEARGRAEDLRRTLEERGVEIWGAADLEPALEALDRGAEHLASDRYRQAEDAFGEAIQRLEGIDARSSAVFQEALVDGDRALEDGNATAAGAAFSLALRIAPESAAASVGLQRAQVLDEVVARLAEGRRSERQGDLEAAAAAYGRAAALDPLSRAAQQALARVQSQMGDNTFARWMSEGLNALDRGDYAAARAAFDQAEKVRPGSTQVAEGLAQVDEAEKLEAIARHRDRAASLEAGENWEAAAAEYRAVLGLDPALQFAREGVARSDRRLDLSQRLAYHLSHPGRFTSEAVLEEAWTLLDEASEVRPAGPVHSRQAEELRQLLAAAGTTVRVVLESDEKTEVTVYQVGRLGAFLRREMELRPGTYTVVGSRPGYRDVRRKLVVEPQAEPEPLVVRCEEKI